MGNSLQVLSDDGERVLYRERRRGDECGSTVLVARAAAEHPAPASEDRLAHEFRLKDELGGAWAVRPLELVREGGHMMLVLEDPGGEPLDRYLGRPMEVRTFLHLAIGLSFALDRLHERGFIHKDIKPANVLVNPATDEVWLTGFGIASRLPRERQVPQPPAFIAGTLAYMAPEQTGRMNRSVDSRSDLYSLGVTFYEMLTGKLPFTAADPMEWVHCHIARQPVSPSEMIAHVPEPLSAIVMKLLAKTAEARYQTAAGVEADLRKCLTAWESSGRIDPFSLGTQGVSDRLMIPERLYGRQCEIEMLLTAFDRVVTHGTVELVLVSGYSGIGKSSVVSELHRVLTPSHGLFASGKFEQYKRDIPYAILTQAFQSLVRPLLNLGESELGQWRNALREALGPNGQLIVNLVHDLELVIGPQPPVPDLPPQDTQNRFQLVFRRFVGVFARREHPLVLFLDDLQWLDKASLDLLEHVITHPDVTHLLLVVAYRDNEVNPAQPLMQTIHAIRETGVRVNDIVLAPLVLDDVCQLVADTLRCEPMDCRLLTELVQDKTGGNPFFVNQFLITLAEEGLLVYDAVRQAWLWDMEKIRAKSYTDNVVALMIGKLKRISATTQKALIRLACLGNFASVATLLRVQEAPEETIHEALWEAVRAGLIIYQDGAYKFLHDRIHQSAYSLIAEERLPELHLRIGRALLANITIGELDDHLFEVANQLNRGAASLTDGNEKFQVATINLRAGRKAKGSAAYASASAYLAAGMALLGENGWAGHHKLMFSLWLESAECEFLTGNLGKAEQLIGELLQHGESKIDLAAVYHLKVELHVVKGEYPQGVDSALTCLGLFGIHIPAHPSAAQLQSEYDTVWRNLDGRPIESFIDLPLMVDDELQAAIEILAALHTSALFTDANLYCLLQCRLVNLSMVYGMSGACARGYAALGHLLGMAFHRYEDGYRFVKLSCDLIEKHGYIAYKAKAYYLMAACVFWTRPISDVLEFHRESFRIANETGDPAYACYSLYLSFMDLLLRNDPLDAVWRESERGLAFVTKSGFRDIADIIVIQRRFIATMQGRTAAFSTFSGGEFDEAVFESQLTADRMPLLICWYWIIKLKARFLSGNYAEALAAANNAKSFLGAGANQIQMLEYCYYAALTMAALYQKASAENQTLWRDMLARHQGDLLEWAKNNAPTFGDKYALVSAEIARIAGRDVEAMRLFEQAIQSANDNGFVQNEGMAHELAARFYLDRGSTTAGLAHLKEARHCYARWGAAGKIRQIEQFHGNLSDEPRPTLFTTVFDAAVTQLDVASVIKASQAVSGEIEHGRLIKTLMSIAIEHAGAERGLLILMRGETLRIEAKAQFDQRAVKVELRQETAISASLPDSILQSVIRTQQSVILDDASAPNPFSADQYLHQEHARSVLCLPLMKQSRLVGLLYLENNLTPHVFTPARTAVLEILASQAAISLENARLYNDLLERETKIRRLVDANIIGIFIWDTEGRIIDANEAFLRLLGYDRKDLISGRPRWRELTPAEWRDADDRREAELKATGIASPYEKEYFQKNGNRVPVLVGAASFEEGRDEGVGFVVDLTDRKRADRAARESERRYHEIEIELAHANRVATMGQLSASIAHEVNQPIAAAITNADAALRWMNAQPPNMEKVRQALARIVANGKRAGDVITRVRALVTKTPPRKDSVEINDSIIEVIALTHGEAIKNHVSVRTQLMEALPLVEGDRVQLQQVILNLIINAVEAMGDIDEGPRELFISTAIVPEGVLVEVRDSGPGLTPTSIEHVFDAFYTTKSSGLGMGLSICRSIIEAHGGKIWVTSGAPRGATFHFTLCTHIGSTS
ncbi:trifunctional serine/threonine-protein kinase/ATP-binding protein/sensor histidine kinase [Trinickia mobilis]|uniref:trifunctional serine/threonine-protein kinase/ATP-binding protein/sensor histidine kinase n=1 Tax=Trinickia mobilis TaxID=2816356 RepID=UPI001F5CE647|nr:ATP-binding sensor histidine kinase [Trinickia mobilis]